jgi:hypothetical protein
MSITNLLGKGGLSIQNDRYPGQVSSGVKIEKKRKRKGTIEENSIGVGVRTLEGARISWSDKSHRQLIPLTYSR